MATSHIYALICDTNGVETIETCSLSAAQAREFAESRNRSEAEFAKILGTPPAVYFVRPIKVQLAGRPAAASNRGKVTA